MTADEANITIGYLKKMQEGYIEGEGYERHPLTEWYALDKAIETIEQTTWIPVSERLPEDHRAVNITWVNHKPEAYYADIKDKPFVATAHYHNGKWFWFSVVCEDYLMEYGQCDCDVMGEDIEVIAWMPLPEPYMEGDSE